MYVTLNSALRVGVFVKYLARRLVFLILTDLLMLAEEASLPDVPFSIVPQSQAKQTRYTLE